MTSYRSCRLCLRRWRTPSTVTNIRLILLCSLGLFGGDLRADCFQPFAHASDALAAVRRRVNQLFKAGGKLRPLGGPDFAEQRFDFREDAKVLAVGVIKEFQADGSVVDEPCHHVPI